STTPAASTSSGSMARRSALVLLVALLAVGGSCGRLAPQARLDLDPNALLALGPQLPFPKADPTGAAGAGGCSVLHYTGGISAASGTRPPCARLYRTGYTAFE